MQAAGSGKHRDVVVRNYLNLGEGAKMPISNVKSPVYDCCASRDVSVSSLNIQKAIMPVIMKIWVKFQYVLELF